MIFLLATYAVFTKLSNIKKESINLNQISSSISISSLNYKYETLEKATDYFNSSRKIGQGGAGSVYKENNKNRILNWKQRFDIILGTAEGLAYLHGGSKTRIIHRDIKCSNVLLDENLIPKIADFGLARCFGADKTYLSTGIAGTLGYMAPEYLIRGQLTDKADVYSFGVLVLEIVCGRRNNVFREDSGSLIQTVWKLYRSNTLAEALDSCLGDDFPATEASRVFHIGLLCAQASASLRPSMAEVVYMLSNSNGHVPTPNQPPFLNTGVLDSDSSITSYRTHSFVSNALNKVGVSCSSSESSSSGSSDRPSRSEKPESKLHV